MSEQPQSKPAAPSPLKELSGRIGKYEIQKPLGKGAMGVVYLAHDTILERDVALKVMVAQIADDPELKQRFEREAKAVARMTHPNVVNVFDLGSHTDGSPYIAMELLKGQDLQKAVRAPSPMPLERKVSVIVQVLAGLAHAHQAGIVHRDIKPANIFISLDGSVKIMDFGVARLTTASMTGTGNIVGTADYMSPEQVKGAKVDGRSDVFSVGCMLYELLAGRRPFHSDNLMAIFYKITHDEPDWTLIPAGPAYEAILPVLKKALAKELEERYQTAYDFAVDLRDYLRVHATSTSGQHALEGLLDLDAPSHPPQPLTDVPRTTLDGAAPTEATIDTGSAAGRRTVATSGRPGTGTQRGVGPTVVVGTDAGARSTVVLAGTTPGSTTRPGTSPGTTRAGAGSTVVRPAPTPRAPAVPRPAPLPPTPGSSASPVLYAVLGAMAVALVGAGGYIMLGRKAPESAPPPVTQAAVPTTLAPPLTPAAAPSAASVTPTAPPTAAPPPTFGETKGKGASSMRAAQSAFKERNYDRAIAEAQKVLAEDPGNADAKRLAENALSGQKAEAHFQAADAALRQSDFGRATSEAEAGRAVAPWDPRATDLLGRIQRVQAQVQNQAQQQKQAQLAVQLNGLLSQADTALNGQKYDAAISLYDEVLKVDPQNQRATLGRTSAVGAKAVSQAAAATGRAGVGRSFVAAKTVAQSIETKATGATPEGFEDTPGVNVKKGSQAAELPGKIVFDVDPDVVKSGDHYNVKVYLLNEGKAPIQVREMYVETKINGRGAGGPIPPLVKDVAPQQKAMLREFPDLWKEDITSWSMEVTVRTVRGESYKNTVTWK
jgi:tRNA A-37 threonylcarbamoyl transferase component Bud32/tetratricopeptide (TPR) repeat protein